MFPEASARKHTRSSTRKQFVFSAMVERLEGFLMTKAHQFSFFAVAASFC